MRIVAVLLLYLAAASSDPMAGNWNADLRTSILPEGFPQLRSQTMELRLVAGKLQCSTERVDLRGATTRAYFVAGFDGKRYPVTGIVDIATVSVKRYTGFVEADFFSVTAPVIQLPAIDFRRRQDTNGRFSGSENPASSSGPASVSEGLNSASSAPFCSSNG